ncbi:hypothetical protein DV736_g3523, partial [Chaetothyriales sp. CBS 134916]
MSEAWQPPSKWQSRPVGVLGGGVLGRRIAACFAAAGYHVRIRDPSAKSRNDAIQYINDNINAYTTMTYKKAGTYEAIEDLAEGVKDTWLIIEAVPEILSLKENTFADLEKHAPADCIIGSNSSSYKTSELLGKVKDITKGRVLNTHFMMPPDAMIVELMTSGYTFDGVLPFVAERMKEAALHPVIALKESTGFVFNRIWAAIKREVIAVLSEGVATPKTIDDVWVEQYSGKAIGPCLMMDGVGLDTVAHIEDHYVKDRHLPPDNLEWLKSNYVSQGKLGAKSDKGGLYPPLKAGTRTRLLLLNIGMAEPLRGKTADQIMHAGQVLAVHPDIPMSKPVELVGKLNNPDGIDVANSTKRMYWTNMGSPSANNGSIQSANLDGSDVKYVVKPGEVHTPKQMFIDQDANKIYYCDREGLRVWRCNLDGTGQEVLFQSGDWQKEPEKTANPTYWPVGIAVSKKLNKFFWTQKGHSKASEGRIFAAGLDLPAGSTPANRKDVEVLIQGLPECIDLELDEEDQVLYWTDRGELPLGNTLNRKTLHGPTPEAEKALGREILTQGLTEGIGLRLDKQKKLVYIADMGGHLWKCPMDGGLKEKLYEGPTHSYTGLCFYKF